MSIIKELEAALAGACDQMTAEAREAVTGPPAVDTGRPILGVVLVVLGPVLLL